MNAPPAPLPMAEQARTAAWLLLLGLPAGVGFMIVGLSTTRSYLRPEYLDLPGQLFIPSLIGWAVILLLLGARRLTRAHRKPEQPIFWPALKLLGSAVFLSPVLAGLCFVASGLALLAAVRYGPATTVEFRSQVVQTDHLHRCRTAFFFYNPPLGRISLTCADDLPIGAVRVGDALVVREQVGKLGGTVTSIRHAAASPR